MSTAAGVGTAAYIAVEDLVTAAATWTAATMFAMEESEAIGLGVLLATSVMVDG